MMRDRKRICSLLLAILLSGSVVSCGSEVEPEANLDVSHDKIYSDIVCGDDEIPWRFPATGTALTSEEYTSSSEVAMSSDGALASYARVDIIEVNCADESFDESEALERAKLLCGDRRDCTLSNLCQSNCWGDGSNAGCTYADATVLYKCDAGAGGKSEELSARATSGTSGTYNASYSLDCRDVGEALVKKEMMDGTLACVPAQCHGRARRNANMDCVVDDSKVEVVLEASFGTITTASETQDQFTKAIIDRAKAEKKIFADPLAINATYNIPITIKFANELVPEEVKFTAWMEDTHSYFKEYDRFRCVPFAFTLKATDPHTTDANGVRTYKKVVTTKFSEDCLEVDPYREMREYVKSVDPGTPGALPYLFVERKNVFQKLHLSYDMVGNSVWHKNLTLANASKLGDSEPECTPNPLGRFYETSTKNYNRSAYYEQRRVATYKAPSGQKLFFSDLYQDRSEIGTIDIVARNEPVVRVFSNRRTLLSFDLSWYVANMDRNHKFNLENPNTRKIRGENRKYINTPRADIFLVPAGLNKSEREAIDPLYLGKVNLSDGKNNGKIEGADDGITQTSTIVFPATAKQKMARDASSPYYIEGESGTFDLFYCINATDGLLKRDAFVTGWSEDGYVYYRNETRLMSSPLLSEDGTPYGLVDTYDLARDRYRVENENKPRREAYWTGPFDRVWSIELENQRMHDPNATPFKYRGCRTAKVPLVVYMDRFKTPIEGTERVPADLPASARVHTDFTDQQDSGDASMSGSNDSGLEETCPNNDSSDVYCSNTSNSGGRSSGEGGRPALDLTTTIERDPPREGEDQSRVAVKFRGQLAEFMALDMSKLAGTFGDMETPGSSRKLTFNISPDWDNVARVLNGSDPSPNTEWDAGTISGREGLGYAIGYTLMFNIGPVPVFVTIKFTAGASVGLKIEIELAPEPGDEYKCLGETEDCFVLERENTGFADAAEACSEAGGRLAELNNKDESDDLTAFLKGENVQAAWIGAQQAYEKNKRVTEYRWLSDSKSFASDENGGTVRYFDNIHVTNKRGLATYGEEGGAVFYNPTSEELGAARVSGGSAGALPYVCTLPPADSEVYFKWSTSVGIGAGAGIALEGCTPSPFVGFCLSAGVNIISAEIAPTVGQTFRWLLREGEAFSRNGVLSFTIPFTLTLFSGEVKALLRITLLLVELSLEWIIHSFDGIKIFEVDLYKLELPVLEDY